MKLGGYPEQNQRPHSDLWTSKYPRFGAKLQRFGKKWSTVRSLDDDKNNIFETGSGLTIPHGAMKKLIQDDHYDIEVKIKDLKAEINKGEDTEIPTSEEDD